MKQYNKYKDSNIAWLGKIPEHWEVDRAKNMFEKQNRIVDESHDTITCFRDGVVTLRKNRRTTGFTESLKEIGYQGICKGDLVIHQMDAFAGSIGVSDSEGKSTPVYSVCIAKGNFNNYYYAHAIRQMAKSGYIQSLYRGIRERSSDFRFDTFAKQYLPIPPRAEQNQIVSYLDWKVKLADKFIEDKRKQIELLKEYRQAEINRVVTKGLNPNVSMRDSGIEWIGEVPEHWNKLFLSQACVEYKNSNKHIQNQNLLSLSYGKVVNKDINKTEGLLPSSFDNYQVVKEGIIVLRLTDLQNDQKSLRVGISSQTGILTSAYIYLECNVSDIPEYIYQLLHGYDIRKVFYGMGGGLRQSLSYQELRKLILFIPPITEQKQIIEYLSVVSNRVDKSIEDIEAQIKLVAEYKTTLISDVVTGKVDVRDIYIPEDSLY